MLPRTFFVFLATHNRRYIAAGVIRSDLQKRAFGDSSEATLPNRHMLSVPRNAGSPASPTHACFVIMRLATLTANVADTNLSLYRAHQALLEMVPEAERATQAIYPSPLLSPLEAKVRRVVEELVEGGKVTGCQVTISLVSSIVCRCHSKQAWLGRCSPMD